MHRLSIKQLFTFVIFFEILNLSMILFFQQRTITIQSDLTRAHENRHAMMKASDQLRQSSDDLTRLARTYAVTGDTYYKDAYFKTLAIRNGESPRPENYENIYWDLLEPLRSKRHPDGEVKSLNSIMNGLPYSKEERNKLEESRFNSDDLVNLEVEAFNAMQGLYMDSEGRYTLRREPDQALAIELLHSKEYHLAKQKIMLPIDAFILALDTRTTKHIKESQTKLQSSTQLFNLSVLCFIVANLYFFYLLNHRVVFTLQDITSSIRNSQGKPLSFEHKYTDEFRTMVDEYKKFEEKLNLAQQRMILAAKSAGIGIWELNLKTNDLLWDEGMHRLYGTAQGSHVNLYDFWIASLHPDDRESAKKDIDLAVKEDREFESEFRIIKPDNSVNYIRATALIVYDMDNQPSHMIGINVDITERRNAHLKLEKSNNQLLELSESLAEEVEEEISSRMKHVQRYRQILDNASELVSLIDRTYTYTMVNKTYLEVFQTSESEIIGHTVSELLGEETFESLVKPKMLQALKGTPIHYQSWFQITPSHRYYMDVSYTPFRPTPSDPIEGLLVIARDITEQHKVEESNKQNEELLVQQSKMASMGEMIGAISHQFKQPINAISLFAQDMADAYRFDELDEETVERNVENIMQQVRFMSHTIDDFRNFFKPSKKKAPFSPYKAIEDVLHLIGPALSKASIKTELQESASFQCIGLVNEFKQVVINILNNARDALVEKEVKNPMIKIEISHDPIYGIITITDNAGGIPEHLLPNKIFEAYISTKGEKGTGIGLQIAKTIIEKNMGGVLLASNVDEGAEFMISIPLAEMPVS